MRLEKLIAEELSGNIAKAYVAEVTRFHRIQASPMYHEAAEHVKSELRGLGLKDAKIEQYTADGKHAYWTYTSPVGWEVRGAELLLVEPEKRLLVSYQDIPQSLHTFSKGTPKGGIVAELIDVGAGTTAKDFEGKKVKGKLVLATGRAKRVHEQAVFKRGAVGVVTDSMPYEFKGVREAIDVPDAHAYQGLWPTAKELRKLAFGFSLSKRQGNHLRNLLKSGKKVSLRAIVDARLFPAHEEVVTATIKGSEKPNEEVFVVGHLCHPKPGANDNASGSGAILEIARTIATLMRSGKIRRPKRTIRFLWVPETLGTVAYLSGHEDIPSRFIAGINLDMVGEDQELCGSTLNMTRTPDSLPSFLNDYVSDVFERSSGYLDKQSVIGLATRFRFATGAFSAGSDHAEFTTSTTRVPCISFAQWPDKFYHTSMDTLDKVSEDSLKRVGWVTAVAILELANAGPDEVVLLATLTSSKGVARIKEAGSKTAKELFEAVESPSPKDNEKKLPRELLRIAHAGRIRIAHIAWRERNAVASAERLGKNRETNHYVKRCQVELEFVADQETSKIDEILKVVANKASVTIPSREKEPDAIKKLSKLVPQKTFKGTLCADLFRVRLGDKGYEFYHSYGEIDRDFENKIAETLNFMDGHRTGADILDAISSEYGMTDPDVLLKLVLDLEKTRLVRNT